MLARKRHFLSSWSVTLTIAQNQLMFEKEKRSSIHFLTKQKHFGEISWRDRCLETWLCPACVISPISGYYWIVWTFSLCFLHLISRTEIPNGLKLYPCWGFYWADREWELLKSKNQANTSNKRAKLSRWGAGPTLPSTVACEGRGPLYYWRELVGELLNCWVFSSSNVTDSQPSILVPFKRSIANLK